MNLITLIGNVGAEPENKSKENFKLVSLTIATNTSWTDKQGNKQQVTQWHNCYTFDEKKCNLIFNHVKKGQKICIVGELVYNSETLTNGKMIKHASINIQKIELL